MRAKSACYLYQKSLSQQLKYQFSNVDATKDYYKLLGVNENSKPNDIKKAFFKLAKKFHPDTNPNSGDKFKEINEAYQVLGDESKKTEYDQIRKGGGGGGFFSGYNQAKQQHQSGSYSHNSNKFDDDIYKKYGFNDYQQKKQQEDNDFYYYWEKKGNYNNSNNNNNNNNNTKNYNTQYNNQRSQQSQSSQQQRETEEELKEYVRKMYAGQNTRFNEFVNQYKGNKQFKPKSEFEKQQFQDMWNKQQKWGQAQQTRKPEYGYDPYEYYVKNQGQFQEKFKDNSYYKSDAHKKFEGQFDTRDQAWSSVHSEDTQRKMAEDLRRHREQQERQRIQDEMFRKEFEMKIEKAKENFSNLEKKVDQATDKAGKVINDIGGRVMNFFKKS